MSGEVGHTSETPDESRSSAAARAIRQVNDLLRSLGNKKAADRSDAALDGLISLLHACDGEISHALYQGSLASERIEVEKLLGQIRGTIKDLA